ncbi:MAG TPA: hypothetical protein VHE09_04045 [Rhizomicrobium sp.]|jgi:hypothetical protein|nr:hypothetical protein [Rhizomicrobium sp.]
MKKRVASLALVAGAVALSFAAGAAPQWQGPGKAPKWSGPGVPHAMFMHPAPGPAVNYPQGHTPAASLAQWNGSFTDLKGHSITYTMVGADPATSNAETHIKVFLIPVVFTYGPSNGNMTLDPRVDGTGVFKTKSVMKALLKSPIFDPGADFKSGNIDCGTGQYIDIYQRCNFWSSVSTNTGYHTILDITKEKHLKPMKLDVSAAQGTIMANPFGDGVVGTYPYSTFQGNANSYISAHTQWITPDTFPFFISYDVYLTSGGCCIGGYHNRLGSHGTGQTYGYTTYVDHDNSFSEDVSAVAHEVGEWLDDPFVDNHVFCQDNSIMENGDPLVPVGQYGTFEQKLHGKIWHPQSLVFIPYFGAPTSISANGWTALHNDLNGGVCPGQ